MTDGFILSPGQVPVSRGSWGRPWRLRLRAADARGGKLPPPPNPARENHPPQRAAGRRTRNAAACCFAAGVCARNARPRNGLPFSARTDYNKSIFCLRSKLPSDFARPGASRSCCPASPFPPGITGSFRKAGQPLFLCPRKGNAAPVNRQSQRRPRGPGQRVSPGAAFPFTQTQTTNQRKSICR